MEVSIHWAPNWLLDSAHPPSVPSVKRGII
jgi:hypothetical protein